MKSPAKMLALVLGLLLFTHSAVCSLKCADITFHNVANHVLVASQHSTVNILFTISTNCLDNGIRQSTVKVYHAKTGKLYCHLDITKTNCTAVGQQDCNCPSDGSKYYQLVTQVNKEDSGTWVWKATTSRVSENASIGVTVTYPPDISDVSLMVDGQKTKLVSQNDDVTIACEIEKGNPHTNQTVRLLWRNGTTERELAPIQRPDDTHVKYVMGHVQCKDMGHVSCDITESGLNRRTPLLIKCPPKFTGAYTEEKDGPSTFLRLPFQSHTQKIDTITVTILTPRDDQSGISYSYEPHEKKNAPEVSGSPPDLELKVMVTEKMREQGDGWKVELSNDVGSDAMLFKRGETTSTFPTTIAALSAVGVFCGIFFVVALAIFIFKKGRRPPMRIYENSPALRQPDPALPRLPLGLQDAGIAMQDLQSRLSDESQSSHTYEEVDDSSTNSETDVAVAMADVSSPQNDSRGDYYLHPAKDTEDLKGKEAPLPPSQTPGRRKEARTQSCGGLAESLNLAVNHNETAMPSLDDEPVARAGAAYIENDEDPCYVNTHT